MKRRSWCALLCALLLFQLAVPRATAVDNVYFVGTEETIQPLNDSTMPFWSKGYLYIASDVFGGTGWKSLGISSVYNANKGSLVIYTNRDRKALVFSLSDDFATDIDGAKVYPGAIGKNGRAFIPAGMIARYFDLTYTVTDVPHGYLVWIRTPDFGLTEKQFSNAATYNMENQYNAYIKNKAPANSEEDVPVQEEPVSGNCRVFLCMKAGENITQQLDVLDRQKVKAAFYCTPDFLEQHGDLLRRMSAAGHAVGIMVDASDPDETAEEQLRRGNEGIYQATCGKTRLVSVLNDDGTGAAAAEKAGYRCLQADLDRTGYKLASTANATSLLQRITTRRGNVKVWIDDTATATGLREFLRLSAQEKCNCYPLTETI